MTCTLNRARKRALVLGAGAGLSSRVDATAVRYEAAEKAHVLVVDDSDFVRAHDADPAATAAPPAFRAVIRGAFVS